MAWITIFKNQLKKIVKKVNDLVCAKNTVLPFSCSSLSHCRTCGLKLQKNLLRFLSDCYIVIELRCHFSSCAYSNRDFTPLLSSKGISILLIFFSYNLFRIHKLAKAIFSFFPQHFFMFHFFHLVKKYE